MQEVYYPVDKDWLQRELRDLAPLVTFPGYRLKVEKIFNEKAKPEEYRSRCKSVIGALNHSLNQHRFSTGEVQDLMRGTLPTHEQRAKLAKALMLERAIAHVLLAMWIDPPAFIDTDVCKLIGSGVLTLGSRMVAPE